MAQIEVESVEKTFVVNNGTSTQALLPTSFDVQPGEFVSLVGPSGCGKSTLMKLVTGLQFPRTGIISVAGSRLKGPLKIAGMAFQASSPIASRN